MDLLENGSEAREASKVAGVEAFGFVSEADGVKLTEDSTPATDFHLMQQEPDDEEKSATEDFSWRNVQPQGF